MYQEAIHKIAPLFQSFLIDKLSQTDCHRDPGLRDRIHGASRSQWYSRSLLATLGEWQLLVRRSAAFLLYQNQRVFKDLNLPIVECPGQPQVSSTYQSQLVGGNCHNVQIFRVCQSSRAFQTIGTHGTFLKCREDKVKDARVKERRVDGIYDGDEKANIV